MNVYRFIERVTIFWDSLKFQSSGEVIKDDSFHEGYRVDFIIPVKYY